MDEFLTYIFGGLGLANGLFEVEDNKKFTTALQGWSDFVMEKERERRVEAERKQKEWIEQCPFKLEQVQFTENEKKRWNIHEYEDDMFYYVTDADGNRLFNETMFFFSNNDKKPMFEFLGKLWEAKAEEKMMEQYIVAKIYVRSEYSNDIVKHCNLKYKHRYERRNCVVDTKTQSIVYTTEREYNDYLNVYDNIMVDDKKNIVYLPTMETLLTKDECKHIYKTDVNLMVVKESYSSKESDKVYLINKFTGYKMSIE